MAGNTAACNIATIKKEQSGIALFGGEIFSCRENIFSPKLITKNRIIIVHKEEKIYK